MRSISSPPRRPRCRGICASFALFRFLTGAGIGGEYTAINSTIQELVPARYRGWTDLVINGSFWIGAALGAAGSIVLLDPVVLPIRIWAGGWRFCIGAALGLVIFFMRLWLPEIAALADDRMAAPHEAERVVAGIEARVQRPRPRLPIARLPRHAAARAPHHAAAPRWSHTLFRVAAPRTLVGLSLMAAQAFFYNAIFFTYALVLTDFYGIRADHVGWYLLPFAAGNFLGPVAARPAVRHHRTPPDDRVHLCAVRGAARGRRAICSPSALARRRAQTIAWMVIFFFASAAASSAYLTVSETFPLEIRALAIAFFYADRHRHRRRGRARGCSAR